MQKVCFKEKNLSGITNQNQEINSVTTHFYSNVTIHYVECVTTTMTNDSVGG